jgi:hypothetical protein
MGDIRHSDYVEMIDWVADYLTRVDTPLVWDPRWTEPHALARQPALAVVTPEQWTRQTLRERTKNLELALRRERFPGSLDKLDTFRADVVAPIAMRDLQTYRNRAEDAQRTMAHQEAVAQMALSFRSEDDGALIARFVRAVYGMYPGGWIELRAFPCERDEGAVKQQWFSLPETLADATGLASMALFWAQKGLNVYVGVLPRTRHGGKKSDVARAGVAWAELDFEKLGGREATIARVKPLKPDVVVMSGGGLHCYWLSVSPLDISERATRDRFELSMSVRQKQLGGDAVHDVARVLRLPQTLNWKRDSPRKVKLLHCP